MTQRPLCRASSHAARGNRRVSLSGSWPCPGTVAQAAEIRGESAKPRDFSCLRPCRALCWLRLNPEPSSSGLCGFFAREYGREPAPSFSCLRAQEKHLWPPSFPELLAAPSRSCQQPRTDSAPVSDSAAPTQGRAVVLPAQREHLYETRLNIPGLGRKSFAAYFRASGFCH